MRRVGEAGTWVIFSLVVLVALSTFLPLREPQIPGTFTLAVIEGQGETRMLAGVRPFCSYLGDELRRAVVPQIVDAVFLKEGAMGAHLILAPRELLPEGGSFQILAWAKGSGMGAAHERPYVVVPRGTHWESLRAPRLILGDRWTWAGGRGAAEFLAERGHPLDGGFSEVAAGHDIYDHTEALAALAHGAFDLAVVRESDLRRAVETGIIDPHRFTFGPAGPPGDGIALAASHELADRARRKVRAAALDLSVFGFDRKHLPAGAALSGLAVLGIEGFVPDRFFPELRSMGPSPAP